MKDFAEDNFKFDENGRQLSNLVEKHCGKRRNCLLRGISPFPTVFSKACFPGVSKGVVVWEWVKLLPDNERIVYTLKKILYVIVKFMHLQQYLEYVHNILKY